MDRRSFLAGAAFGSFLAPGPAAAQDDPAACTSITDDKARLACFDRAEAGPPGSLATFKGNGIKNLPPFTVNGNWMIHWQTTGNFMSVDVKTDPSQDPPADSLMSTSSNPSSSYESVTGTIYLTVESQGDWVIWISAAQ